MYDEAILEYSDSGRGNGLGYHIIRHPTMHDVNHIFRLMDGMVRRHMAIITPTMRLSVLHEDAFKRRHDNRVELTIMYNDWRMYHLIDADIPQDEEWTNWTVPFRDVNEELNEIPIRSTVAKHYAIRVSIYFLRYKRLPPQTVWR